MTTKKAKTKKLTFKIPKNDTVRVLTPDETRQLVERSWGVEYTRVCRCRARGCEDCHNRGILMLLSNPRRRKHLVTGTPFTYPGTGAALTSNWSVSGSTFRFVLDAQSGSADFELTLPQALRLAQVVINVAAGQYDVRATMSEFGVIARLSGPPIMRVAGVRSRHQHAMELTPDQAAAVHTLRSTGTKEAADFLEQAYKHECFQNNAEQYQAARKRVGKLEPGTILQRKQGVSVTVDDDGNETLVEIDDQLGSASLMLGML